MAGPLTVHAPEGFSEERKALLALGLRDVADALMIPKERNLLGRFLGLDARQTLLKFATDKLLFQKELGDGWKFAENGQGLLFYEVISISHKNAYSDRGTLGISKLHPKTGFKGQFLVLILRDGWIGVADWDAVKKLVADGRLLNDGGNEQYYYVSREDMRSVKCQEHQLAV